MGYFNKTKIGFLAQKTRWLDKIIDDRWITYTLNT